MGSVNIPNAPPADTALPWPLLVDATLEELVVYYPNHVFTWPGLALIYNHYRHRIANQLWDPSNILQHIRTSRGIDQAISFQQRRKLVLDSLTAAIGNGWNESQNGHLHFIYFNILSQGLQDVSEYLSQGLSTPSNVPLQPPWTLDQVGQHVSNHPAGNFAIRVQNAVANAPFNAPAPLGQGALHPIIARLHDTTSTFVERVREQQTLPAYNDAIEANDPTGCIMPLENNFWPSEYGIRRTANNTGTPASQWLGAVNNDVIFDLLESTNLTPLQFVEYYWRDLHREVYLWLTIRLNVPMIRRALPHAYWVYEEGLATAQTRDNGTQVAKDLARRTESKFRKRTQLAISERCAWSSATWDRKNQTLTGGNSPIFKAEKALFETCKNNVTRFGHSLAQASLKVPANLFPQNQTALVYLPHQNQPANGLTQYTHARQMAQASGVVGAAQAWVAAQQPAAQPVANQQQVAPPVFNQPQVLQSAVNQQQQVLPVVHQPQAMQSAVIQHAGQPAVNQQPTNPAVHHQQAAQPIVNQQLTPQQVANQQHLLQQMMLQQAAATQRTMQQVQQIMQQTSSQYGFPAQQQPAVASANPAPAHQPPAAGLQGPQFFTFLQQPSQTLSLPRYVEDARARQQVHFGVFDSANQLPSYVQNAAASQQIHVPVHQANQQPIHGLPSQYPSVAPSAPHIQHQQPQPAQQGPLNQAYQQPFQPQHPPKPQQVPSFQPAHQPQHSTQAQVAPQHQRALPLHLDPRSQQPVPTQSDTQMQKDDAEMQRDGTESEQDITETQQHETDMQQNDTEVQQDWTGLQPVDTEMQHGGTVMQQDGIGADVDEDTMREMLELFLQNS